MNVQDVEFCNIWLTITIRVRFKLYICKPLNQIKAYRTGYQTRPKILKKKK